MSGRGGRVVESKRKWKRRPNVVGERAKCDSVWPRRPCRASGFGRTSGSEDAGRLEETASCREQALQSSQQEAGAKEMRGDRTERGRGTQGRVRRSCQAVDLPGTLESFELRTGI